MKDRFAAFSKKERAFFPLPAQNLHRDFGEFEELF
jgi:hypothetical protein